MAFFIYYFGTKYSRYTRENTVIGHLSVGFVFYKQVTGVGGGGGCRVTCQACHTNLMAQRASSSCCCIPSSCSLCLRLSSCFWYNTPWPLTGLVAADRYSTFKGLVPMLRGGSWAGTYDKDHVRIIIQDYPMNGQAENIITVLPLLVATLNRGHPLE